MADDMDDAKVKDQNSKVEEQEEVKPEEKTEEIPVVETAAEEAKTEEVKEEPVVEAPKAEEPALVIEEVKEPAKALTGNLKKLAGEIEGLTVLELSELSTYLEEKFGVSAAPMMMAGGMAPAAGAAAGEPAEEKTSFNVVLTDGGATKLGVIKAVRELRQDLGLMEAKKMVETPPQTILENVKKDEADAAVKKLTEAGAKAELK